MNRSADRNDGRSALVNSVAGPPHGGDGNELEVGVADEDKLSAVLSEFARTMITDFPIQRILDRLVDRIVDVLPVTSAGVTLISEGSTPHYIAASDQSARRFERLQTEMDQGPCLEAYRLGEPVSVPDLRIDARFPSFSPAAVEAGLVAVFTFPLFHGPERFGALDLYRDTPGDLTAADMIAAQTLADVAAALLLNAKARQEALETSNRFHFNAMHDPLTGLPNRALLQERLEHAARRAHRTRTHTYTAVLFLDLDRFKQVNDTHGHLIGDELLRAIAARLMTLVRSGDTLARLSGDEFVYLCEDLHSIDDVTILVNRIDDTFSEPFNLEGVDVTVRASIGTAYVGPGEAITSDLLTRADHEMYRTKRETAAELIHRVDPLLNADDHSLEDDMRRALTAGELSVAYQPIVGTTDGVVIGAEALLRWTHPHRGPIPALLMVSVAERSELICEIGSWVLEQACTDHADWAADPNHDTPLTMSVNVSVRQLMLPDFCDTVSAVLTRTGMNAGSLVLELTESIAIEHSARIMHVLDGLNKLGVRLALDVFGTGYSSLTYLSKLPIHIVKIDRIFTADADKPAGRIVVAAVTGLAHDLGLTVVAEGVETESQRDEVTAAGCDYAQGYFFGRPMPTASFREHLVAEFLRPVVEQHPALLDTPAGA